MVLHPTDKIIIIIRVDSDFNEEVFSKDDVNSNTVRVENECRGVLITILWLTLGKHFC